MTLVSTTRHEALLPGFVDACRRVGATKGPDVLQDNALQIAERWGESERIIRAYHCIDHLAEVLDRLRELGADRPAPVLAAWFHDAVYDARPGEDEEASARLAEDVLTRLGVAPWAVTEVAAMVRMTAGHVPSMTSPDQQALSDADLAILATERERYDAYAAAIRIEYGHVPEEAFRTGRAQVLERFIFADRIFHTEYGVEEWDRPARANLRRELSTLR